MSRVVEGAAAGQSGAGESHARDVGGTSTSYAPPSKGFDRKLSRQGSRVQNIGGTQQFGNSTMGRREVLDQMGGRDSMSRSGAGGLRQPAGHYPGTGPPTVSTRPSSRPASSAFGNIPSPRGQHNHNLNSSYRDAALIAAQHGLSAYAPSANATANSRNLNSRSGPPPMTGPGNGGVASGPHSSHGIGGGYGGCPPPPRNAPMGQYYTHLYHANSGIGSGERLPSRSGPPASRGGMPPSRSGMPPSRSGPPPCSRGGIGGGAGPPPPSSPGAYHRPSEPAHGADGPWRGSHDPVGAQEALSSGGGRGGSHDPVGAQEALSSGGGRGGVAVNPLSVTAGAKGLAPSGWGATAVPSAYEVDGRPGTRGGGPQYDMEGRPTTRGGQRPPSRAQMGMAPGGGGGAKPPPGGHVPPLGGPGWASMFSGAGAGGGGGGVGGGQGNGSGNGQGTLPSGPGLGAGGGGGGGGDLSGSLRRPLPLPLPPGLAGGSGGSSGGGSFSSSSKPGVLSSLGPPHHHHQHHHSLGSGGGALGGTGRMGSKLTSIAEAPSSPAMLSPKTPGGRLDSAGGGVGGGALARKSSRERDLMLSSIPDGVTMDAFLDGISEEGVNEGGLDSDIDSYLANLDQDGSNRGGKLGSRRSNTASSNTSNSNSRQHSSHGGSSQLVGGVGGAGVLDSPAT